MPLERDWQLPELARSVTLPIPRWPINRLQGTAPRAAAEPERWAVHAVRVRVGLEYAGGSFLCVTLARK
jgi:hypothetical protein